MSETTEYSKTKRALRKIKKRQAISYKKRYLPMPRSVRYIVDETGDFLIVSGEIEGGLDVDAEHFIRFKLSGQQDFPIFGYQAKIPIQKGSFQFEILQDALLEKDYFEVQLFNNQKQYSDRFVCHYEKVQLVREVRADGQVTTESKLPSRTEKYRIKKGTV